MPKAKAEKPRAKSAHPKTEQMVSESKGQLRSKSQFLSKASKGKKSKKDTQSVGVLAFSAGDYIAFVDPDSEDPTNFKIGLIISDVKQNDKQVSCKVYEQLDRKTNTLIYLDKCHTQKVDQHTIISEIAVEVVVTKKVKKRVKITKEQRKATMLSILLQSEAEESDEQIIEIASPTTPKRFLRINGVKTISTQADVQIKDKEDLPQSQDTKKNKPKAKAQNAQTKPSKVIPEIGKKRAMREVDVQYESEEEEEAPTTSKRRRVGTGKSQKIEQFIQKAELLKKQKFKQVEEQKNRRKRSASEKKKIKQMLDEILNFSEGAEEEQESESESEESLSLFAQLAKILK